MIETARIALIIYGALVIAGGVMGYAKAGSTASLISGLIFGVVALAAGISAFRAPGPGLTAGLAASLFVGVFFLFRFLHTRALMPAGMTLALSVLVAVLTFLALRSIRA
ncbi:MAG: hypothetical protein KatS3mg024_0882 [Armatimonadota bacterium]|nr:MAG: hypothetical protein KatS3mg024_0882 [Armatimonadota bacterium]